jgi:hypothetical protein
MIQPGNHIIRDVSVNFLYNGNVDGIAIRQEVADWCNNVLLHSFDSILAEYDQTEEVILIDSLSLNIDLGETENWKKALSDNIVHQLKDKIHDKISSLVSDIEVKSKSASFSETLLYYLEFGFLPWYSNFRTADDFKAGLKSWLNKSLFPEIKNLPHILPDDKSIRRLAMVLDQQDLETLLAYVVDESGEKISSFLVDAKVIIESLVKEKKLQPGLLNDFKAMLVEGFKAGQPAGLLLITFTAWINYIRKKYQLSFSEIDPKVIINPEIKNIILQFRQDSLYQLKQKQRLIRDYPEKTRSAADKNEVETSDSMNRELSEGVFISNAGAVIIAPFLNLLFSNTGILTNGIINDEATAVSLVHYCITGQAHAVEFELLLPKILCGINPEVVLEITPLADNKFIKEADEMLASVIGHWTALKDTSAEGLREAFLRRNGKLSFTGNEWLLVVEQKSYDILLQYLPWNISMIRLSWMKNILRTQWI